jgi:hypothetical protein
MYRNFSNTFKILNTLKDNNNKAYYLYRICLLDKSINIDIPHPHQWLLFQNNMRELWEAYKAKCETISFCRDLLLNSSYANYMSFMYETYPANFSDKIKEYINLTSKNMNDFYPCISGLVLDIGKIFDKL